METDKLFNLQLTVQRLEEELKLYRNGATAEQLLDLIAEKDQEIEELKNTLRKMSRSSSAVLLQCEQLREQVKDLTKHQSDKDIQLEEANVTVDKLHRRCAELVSEKASKLSALNEERHEMITHVQEFKKSMQTHLEQREAAFKRKDEKIRELTLQLSIANKVNASSDINKNVLKNKQLQGQDKENVALNLFL